MNLPGYAKMQKDEGPHDPNLFPSPPDPIKSHPLFSGAMPVAFMSGSDPKYPTKIAGQSDAMKAMLDKMGLKHERTRGKYGGPEEDSFIVYNPTREQAFDLGHQFGQESVMYSHGGNHQILYTNGEDTGRYHPSLPQVWYNQTEEPEDYFTQVPNHGFLRLHFDWDSKRDAPDRERLLARTQAGGSEAQAIAKSMAGVLRTTLKKNEGVLPHPHSYPWHEGHTSHHFMTTGHGVLVHRNHFDQPLGKGERKFEQRLEKAWTPSPDGAIPQFGSAGASTPSPLPIHGKDAQIDDLIKNHGYTVSYWGGRHGRPDLARRNYDTRHIPVFDPSSGSEGAYEHQGYVNNWRKVHELAHALTHDDINKLYGNGRRRGALGARRTTREAMRAVHWEYLAMHKQRDLMRQMGVEVPDHTFNRELNTVMQDAVHRVLTGEEQHPALHSFAANEHSVPLEASLNLIRQGAHNLGLRGPHDLVIKKSEEGKALMADKNPTVQEMKKSLADGLRVVLAKHEEGMAQLRSRELKKSGNMCPTCGKLDKPGSCSCVLRKDEGKADHAFKGGNKGNEKQVKTCTQCGQTLGKHPEHAHVIKDEAPADHKFEGGNKGNEKQVKTCTKCGQSLGKHPGHTHILGKGEACPVCKCEDKLGKCGCFKKGEKSVAPPAKKVKGDEGSGGDIKALNKGSLPAGVKPTSAAQADKEIGSMKSLIGGNPAPTMAAKLTGAVPPSPSVASPGTKAVAGKGNGLPGIYSSLSPQGAKALDAVPTTGMPSSTKAIGMAPPPLSKPAGGPPPIPASARKGGGLPGAGLNSNAIKSLLAVPVGKGEKGWSKKAKKA